MATTRRPGPGGPHGGSVVSLDEMLRMPFDALRGEVASTTSRGLDPSAAAAGSTFLNIDVPGRGGHRSSAHRGGHRAAHRLPSTVSQFVPFMGAPPSMTAPHIHHHRPPMTPGMTYEEMLHLDQDNVCRGVKPRALNVLRKGLPNTSERQQKCQVCLSQLGQGAGGGIVMKLPCKHSFCDGCIRQWLKTNVTCPVCRWEFPERDTQIVS